MKNLFYFLLSICVVAACAPAATTTSTTTSTTTASVTTVVRPAGLWNYTITETPEGDFAGIFTVTQAGELFTATIALRGNEFPIENFAFDKATNKLTGQLQYSGLVIAFDALLTGDELNGAFSEGGMDFPFKATRKK